MRLDIAIENGWIADGVSGSLHKGTIGIRDGKIECIAVSPDTPRADVVIDAANLCVAPGFIDVGSHADHFLLIDPVMKNKLMQGVTTEIGGNCGSSAYPWNKGHAFYLPEKEGTFSRKSFADFLGALERNGIAINFGSLVGYDSLVSEASANGRTRENLGEMKRILARSMEEGAFGLSTGVRLERSSIRQIRQVMALCRVAAKRNGVLSVHLRSESGEILEALSEAVFLADRSGVRLQISHFKTLDRPNWPKHEQALELIEKMRLGDIDTTMSCIPYTVGCAPLSVLMPQGLKPESFGGRAGKESTRAAIMKYLSALFPAPRHYRGIVFPYLGSQRYRAFIGTDLLSAAEHSRRDPREFLIDLALEEGLDRFVYYECISERNKRMTIQHSGSMVASDSFPTAIPDYFKNHIIHPRTFGAFPQFLSDFVYGNHLLTLPAAIRKVTSLPARKFGLRGRGMIKEGAWADITIFDPERLDPGASLAEPCKSPSGIEYVLVNGRVALERGKFTGAFPGMALRRE